MILGIRQSSGIDGEIERDLLAAAEHAYPGGYGGRPVVWSADDVVLCSCPPPVATLAEPAQPFRSEDGRLALVFIGKIYNAKDLKARLSAKHRFGSESSGEVLVHLYEEHGREFLRDVNGKFAFALWDGSDRTLVLGRDRFGIESMFYANRGDRLVFGSSLRGLVGSGHVPFELNHDAILQYLLYCYNPGDPTVVNGVSRLPAASLLTSTPSGIEVRKYWNLSFAEVRRKSENTYREEFIDLARDAIGACLDDGESPGILLSGGTDSSAIVSIASESVEGTIQSFSFRCRQGAYDESEYARFVAKRYGTRHSEITYDAESLRLIEHAADWMEEPFCDIGIEVGTYLLGQAARGKVSYVLSGEGGDELFAGHPVYVADKVARAVDWVPRPLLRPMTWWLGKVPDSEQKNNVQVKLKRFAYGLQFPRKLLSNRWRIYYTRDELRQLCSPDFLRNCTLDGVCDPMAEHGALADGNDLLSRCLYVDYQTLVGFYLRRLGLLKAFGVESRLPLLDHRLAEYAAAVPSDLKIKGWSETKYIYRKILEAVLPREILYDRPKLGHSVPMKNWMREDTELGRWMEDRLSSLEQRDLFRAGFVSRLIEEHRSKRENHSHRLWGLVVLELWLRSMARVRDAVPSRASAPQVGRRGH